MLHDYQEQYPHNSVGAGSPTIIAYKQQSRKPAPTQRQTLDRLKPKSPKILCRGEAFGLKFPKKTQNIVPECFALTADK